VYSERKSTHDRIKKGDQEPQEGRRGKRGTGTRFQASKWAGRDGEKDGKEKESAKKAATTEIKPGPQVGKRLDLDLELSTRKG